LPATLEVDDTEEKRTCLCGFGVEMSADL